MVPIDAMRVISNLSTGALGQRVANDFAKAGSYVTLLEGPVKKPLSSRTVKVLKFEFFDELAALIKSELKKKYDVCVHAAAVSDFKVKQPSKSKISSRSKSVKLKLVPTGKIIRKIKKYRPETFLVGFKFETDIAKAKRKARNLFAKSHCDLVVANCLNKGRYAGLILNKKRVIGKQVSSRHQLSKALISSVNEEL